MKGKLSLCKILLLFLGTTVVQFIACYAQEESQKVGFAVTMGSQALSGRPGSTANGSLIIIPTGIERPSSYSIKVMDLGQTPSGSLLPVEQGTGARSLAGWIDIPESVEIAPGQRMTVPFSVSIPPNSAGSYFAYINVRLKPKTPEGEKMVIIVNPTVSVRVELEVPGRNQLEITATEMKFDRNLEAGRSGLILELKNEGNVKISVEGDILLYGARRSFPIRVELPVDRGGKPYVIYPELTRHLNSVFTEDPPPGKYRAEARLRIGRRWRTNSSFDIVIPRYDAIAPTTATSLGRSEFDIDIVVSPEYVEVMVPRNATRTVSIRAQNRDSVEVYTRVSVMNVTQELNGFLTYADIADPSKQWVQISPSELTLKPNSTRNIVLKITAPDYETSEGNMCVVRLTGTAGTDESGWLSEADLGVPVIVIPPNSSPPLLEITKLEVVRPGETDNPTAAVFVVWNRGGRTANVTGELALERTITGENIQKMRLAGAKGLILPPGTMREFRMPLSYLDRDEFSLKAMVLIKGQAKSEKQEELTFICYKGPE